MKQTIKIFIPIFLIILLCASAVQAAPVRQIDLVNSQSASGNYRVETYENGDQYAGNFLNGKYNGQGTYTWANGDRYEGEFKDGQINGTGRLTFFGNGQYWEGTFVQGQISSGTGIFSWGSNGDKFDGQWVNGVPDGTGILLHADGTSSQAHLFQWTIDQPKRNIRRQQ